MNSEAADRMEEDYWGLSIKNGITVALEKVGILCAKCGTRHRTTNRIVSALLKAGCLQFPSFISTTALYVASVEEEKLT